jgi:hypothetical protein
VDDRVIVTADPRLLVVLDRDLATVRWTQKTPAYTSPRLLLWRGLVLSGNQEGELVGFCLHDDRPCFRQRLGRSMSTLSGDVHALVLGALGPAAASDR